MTYNVRCCLCNTMHDWDDPEDNTLLVLTDRGRRFVCMECTTAILAEELDRRGLR